MDNSKCKQTRADYLHMPSLAMLGVTGKKGVMMEKGRERERKSSDRSTP